MAVPVTDDPAKLDQIPLDVVEALGQPFQPWQQGTPGG